MMRLQKYDFFTHKDCFFGRVPRQPHQNAIETYDNGYGIGWAGCSEGLAARQRA
jgi:diadenosine tetraphosphatase ApaH/serine/threonine PP2A family protein phosphatase